VEQSRDLKSQIENSSGARLFRAPGRVNLIGEHTDYNDGFVLPAALDYSTWVSISPRDDRAVSLFSENFNEQFSFDLDDPDPQARRHWSDYVRGVALTLESAGYRLRGARLHIRGDVPIGSGLSSSAALEVAAGYALLATSGFTIDRVELAKLCQRAENEFVGMRCGIMDQFVSCHGQKEKAMLLDCRSLEYRLLPLSEQARLVICNTMVKHELAGGEYNQRRVDCEAGVRHLAQKLPGVRALRDVTEADLESHGRDLPEMVYRRCRHVITENARTLQAAAALEREALADFGRLMNESHCSLRDDYEVSCEELDLMVELAKPVTGTYGARMIGGGFGGCTINLVAAENVDEFRRQVAAGYKNGTGLSPEIYVCSAAAGAEEVISRLANN
jgi:galactokinase